MCDFPPSLSMYHTCASCTHLPEMVTGSPGIAECYKLPCRCWELSPSSSGKEYSAFSWYPISLDLLKLFNSQNYLLVMTENSIFLVGAVIKRESICQFSGIVEMYFVSSYMVCMSICTFIKLIYKSFTSTRWLKYDRYFVSFAWNYLKHYKLNVYFTCSTFNSDQLNRYYGWY